MREVGAKFARGGDGVGRGEEAVGRSGGLRLERPESRMRMGATGLNPDSMEWKGGHMKTG